MEGVPQLYLRYTSPSNIYIPNKIELIFFKISCIVNISAYLLYS